MIKVLMAGVLPLVFIVGCAGNNNSHKVKSVSGGSLDVATIFAPEDMNDNRHPDIKLREVTPMHSGAGMGVAVLGAAFGGVISSGAFDKDNYKGTTIDAMPEPTARYLGPKADMKIQSWLEKMLTVMPIPSLCLLRPLSGHWFILICPRTTATMI